jgi:hypothetical protein
VLGSAIEALIPPLIQFVGIILHALRPILPPIEAALAQLGRAIGRALVQAVRALLPGLAQLVVAC